MLIAIGLQFVSGIDLLPTPWHRVGRDTRRVPSQKGVGMKSILAVAAVLCGLGLASALTPARADADDAAWIKKCVSDNKREGATPEVVAAYCACMNGKMSSNETL